MRVGGQIRCRHKLCVMCLIAIGMKRKRNVCDIKLIALTNINIENSRNFYFRKYANKINVIDVQICKISINMLIYI